MQASQATTKFLIHTPVFPSGERFPILLWSDSRQPVSLPTRYIVDERRDYQKTSTIEKDVRSIKWLYE